LLVTVIQIGVSYGVHGIFDNSPRNFYATQLSETRMRGQFSEPSHLGAFATAALAFALSAARVMTGRARIFSIALAAGSVVCVIASATGTALVAIIPLVAIYVVGGIARAVISGKVSSFVIVALPVAAGATIVLMPRAIQLVNDLVSTKLTSISYIIRAPQDANAWSLLWGTNGLGVGLGSNRSSSLATMMLSTVGVPGVLLLSIMLISVLYVAARSRASRPAAWALLAYVTCAAISVADFTSPVMWLAAGACYAEYKRVATDQSMLLENAPGSRGQAADLLRGTVSS
jgi:hypothetical protein